MSKRLEAALYAVLLLIGIAATTMMFVKPANADLWTMMKNSSLEETASVAHRVNALGFDVRVYEFKPKTQPEYTCVMAFGQTHPVGMQCFPDQQ